MPVILAPETRLPCSQMLRPIGSESSRARLSVCVVLDCRTSTRGDAPDTVTDSWIDPTFNVPSTVAVKFEDNSMPSRITRVKPSSEKVTV